MHEEPSLLNCRWLHRHQFPSVLLPPWFPLRYRCFESLGLRGRWFRHPAELPAGRASVDLATILTCLA